MLPKLLAVLAAGATLTAWGGDTKDGRLENIQRLTADASVKYENPTFSPDGKQIAFTMMGYQGIYVMNADGTGKRCLTDMDGAGYLYQWSADGSQILFRDTRWEGTEGDLVRLHSANAVDVNTGAVEKLTADAEDMQPAAWRYVGTQMGIVTESGAHMKAMPAAMMSTKDVREAITRPEYSMSFVSDFDHLWAVDALGNRTVIYDGPAFRAQLSPDGTLVAFVTMTDDIMVCKPDGSAARVITKGFTPVWVSDSQLIYERTTDDGHIFTTGELMMVDINSGATKSLTDTPARIEMNPSVSADRSKILFTDFNDGQVYIANIH